MNATLSLFDCRHFGENRWVVKNREPERGCRVYSDMPHYFFHVYNGRGNAADEEGRDLPGMAAARQEAIGGIRSLLREEIGAGVIDLCGRIEVADPNGNILLTVPFEEAIEIRSQTGA